MAVKSGSPAPDFTLFPVMIIKKNSPGISSHSDRKGGELCQPGKRAPGRKQPENRKRYITACPVELR
jgi:hypothetical protein